MASYDARLLLVLALLVVTGTNGQQNEIQYEEDYRNRTGYTTQGYSGTTSSSKVGVIMSPGYPGNYPNNYRFRYDISLGKEKSDLEITFKIFDLEDCSNCNCDYVMIENYKLAKPLKYCGAKLPNGNGQVFLDNLDDYVWITFHSNSDQRRPGFYATYEVTQKAGNDSFLAGGSVCPPIACPYCDVGQTQEYDYTSVCPYCYCRSYGSSNNTTPYYSHSTATLCPPVHCPSCPYGFRQHWDYSSRCSHCYCVHDSQNNDTSTSTYWRPTTSTTTYDVECGVGYFYSSSGVIRSTGAPAHRYPNNADCSYNIDLGGVRGVRKTVALTFDFFDLEYCYNCNCDALTIDSQETSGKRMCENRVNTSRTYYVHTTSDIMPLRFTTDGSVTGAGFSLTYDVLGAGTNETSCDSHCPVCNYPVQQDYFGCCFCSPGGYNTTTPGYTYNMTSPGTFSPSLLLQLLTNIANQANTLEQYAHNLQNEANYAKNLVAQTLG